MFITKPIKEFSIDNNVLKINEKEFRFSGMENLDNEILESLISKGAYASTMLYLNKNCLLESVNNKKITSRQYRSYLRECKKLLKENVYEATEGNFKPLGNINGLELLENDEHIARGKHKLMIEDFRTLKEQDIIIPSNSEDGWGEDVDDLTYDFFDQVDRISYEIKNARRGSYAGIGTDIDSLANAFDEIANMASEISSTLANAEVNYSSDETEYDDGDTNWAAEEEADATERMEKRYGGIEESVNTQQPENLKLSDIVDEYCDRLSKFLSKYNITFKLSPRYVTYLYNGDYLYSKSLVEGVNEKGRLRDKIRRIQNSLRSDGLARCYIREVYGDEAYESTFKFKPEYDKKKDDMYAQIKEFVSSCKDLEDKESQALKNLDAKNNEREHKLLGDNVITVIYNSDNTNAPGGANIHEVKEYFNDIKHKTEKVGSTYYFTFNRNDEEAVKDKFNALQNIADVSIEGLNESSNLKEESVNKQQSEDVVEEFQHSEKTYDNFMKALNKISALEDSNEITREQYEDCINVIIADFKSRHESVNEECEGTQCSDIAEKKDQELGLVKPEDPNKLIVKESNLFNVDYNHGFKGFILDENGRFVRGKYVLINENGKIKAVKKSMLEQYMSEAQDKYGNNILDRDSAEALMQKVVDELNKAFTYEYEGETLKPYDFKYRFQGEDICLFDANEEFTNEDKNYEKVEEIVKKTMSMPNIYLEPETNVTMIIAGCYLK